MKIDDVFEGSSLFGVGSDEFFEISGLILVGHG
jgi:hypothetical protein